MFGVGVIFCKISTKSLSVQTFLFVCHLQMVNSVVVFENKVLTTNTEK